MINCQKPSAANSRYLTLVLGSLEIEGVGGGGGGGSQVSRGEGSLKVSI